MRNETLRHNDGAGDARSTQSLARQLTALGFRGPALRSAGAGIAAGLSLRVAIRDALKNSVNFAAVAQVLTDSLQQGIPVTLSLCRLGRGEAAYRHLQRFCESLQAVIAERRLPGHYLGLCIDADRLPLPAIQVLSSIVPGNGPRYINLDRRQMTPQASMRRRASAHRDWSFLWRDRLAPGRLLPVYGTAVRTACRLLPDEAASSVLPPTGIAVPAASAWLPLELPLAPFAGDSGTLDRDKLLAVLEQGVSLADQLLDQLRWGHPAQAADALANRRLALSLTGLGDLVRHRGADPRDLATLRWLAAEITRTREVVWRHSALLAHRRGHLPALDEADPSRDCADPGHRKSWRRCWQEALVRSAVRHRNLLILSPYSLLPDGACGRDGYTDLLPAIAHADGWCFSGAPHFRDWSREQFTSFHRRAWAVMQQSRQQSVVAAGV